MWRFCPVIGLQLYVSCCKKFRLNLSKGFIFRIVIRDFRVLEQPVSNSVVYERWRMYRRFWILMTGRRHIVQWRKHSPDLHNTLGRSWDMWGGLVRLVLNSRLHCTCSCWIRTRCRLIIGWCCRSKACLGRESKNQKHVNYEG